MKKIKALIRLLFIILLLTMAAFGIGFANIFSGTKGEYLNREIKTEQIENRKEDEEGEDEIT